MTASSPPHSSYPPRSRFLLIDVDGTLVDSFPGIRDSFLQALADNGIAAPTEEEIQRIPGPPIVDTLRGLGLNDQVLRRTIASYRDDYARDGWRNATVVNGIPELLAQWKDAGIILSTATSKLESTARMMLEEVGLLDYFDVVAAASQQLDQPDGRRSKSDVIAYALEQLGLDPTPVDQGGPGHRPDILMIGDRIHDVDGAHAFGIRSVLVDWGYGDRSEHAASDWSVADVKELQRVVTTWADDRPHLSVVCTGNICRSPMGEIMLRQALNEAGLGERITLDSCGTTGWHVGEAADPRAVAWLHEHGYLATGHRAQVFGVEHQDVDLFLVMDDSHRKSLIKAGVDPARIANFRSFSEDHAGGATGSPSVADPYYGDTADFDRVGRQLQDALPGIVEYARKLLKSRQ